MNIETFKTKLSALIFKLLLFMFLISINNENAFSNVKYITLSGIVSESESGENIIGVPVALYKDTTNKNAARGAITNKFGFYSIPKLSEGEYYLMVSGIGYETFIQKIIISKDTILNIKLNIQAIMSEEVIVTAERLSEPINRISSVIVKPDFVMKMPSIGGEIDVFRTLQLLPGVKQGSELSSGLYIRGGSADQNLVLLDGVIVYNPSHLGGFLSSFNSDALRDIKLIKGAFPAEYGGRLSSVIDMTMKEGTKNKISGTGGISLISSRLTVEGPINENSTFMISGRRMYLDIMMWMADKIVPSLMDFDNTPKYYFYDFNAKVNYKISEKDRVFLSGYFCRDVLNSPKRVDDFGIYWGNQTANLRWMHIMSPIFFTNLSLIYTNYNFNVKIDNSNNSSHWKSTSQIRDIMVKLEGQYFPNKDHTYKFGSEITHHNFDVVAGTYFHNNNLNKINDVKNSFDIALYAQDEWKISQLINSNIGMRAYYFSLGNHINLEPRLSASYSLSDNSSLSLSTALAHQFLHMIVRNDIPLPTDVWYPSTKNIKPQRSWQSVISYEQLFKDSEYLFSAELYYKTMNNLLEYKEEADFSLAIPLESQFTKGNGYAYGLELFLNRRFGNFTGWIGYTLSWTKRKFEDLNLGKEFYPRYDRRHDISLTFNYNLGKKWELGASWVFATGQAFTMPTGIYSINYTNFEHMFPFMQHGFDQIKLNFSEKNGSRMSPFHKLDLNFMYKFTWFDLPFQLSLNIYNAYNRKNPFMWFLDTERNYNSYKQVLKQFTLFPFMPTIGLSFKF